MPQRLSNKRCGDWLMLESPPMKLSRHNHTLITWLLAASLLISLLACAIAHGQLSGLQLSGIGGQYCTSSQGTAPTFGNDLSSPSDSTGSISISCPLCTGLALNVLALGALYWLALRGRTISPNGTHRSRLAPRHCWPASSPRAPPWCTN